MKFCDFCALHNVPAFPCSASTVMAYIYFLRSSGFSPSSISAALSAISYRLKMLSLQDTTKLFIVSQLMASIRRTGVEGDRRKPITPTILQQLINALEHLGLTPYEFSLFKAIFLTAFNFALRLSEYTSSPHTLMFDNLTLSTDAMEIKFSSFKHSSGADLSSHRFDLSSNQLCPVSAMQSYITLRGSDQGPLFCFNGQAIQKSYFSAILRKAVSATGLPPSSFTSHSFRIGATTTWAQQGIPEVTIRQRGRWKSFNAVAKYLRGSISHN